MERESQIPSVWIVIAWWEIRRIVYNLLLLTIGIVSLIGFEFRMERAIPSGVDAEQSFVLFFSVLAYAILANLCYTLGWIVELAGRHSNPTTARQQGKRNFQRGLLFSSALTTAPFWYACLFHLAHSMRPR